MKPLLLRSTILTVLVGVGGASLIASPPGQPDAAQAASIAAPVPAQASEPAATPSVPARLASAPVVEAGRPPVPIERAPIPPAVAKVTPPPQQEQGDRAGGSAIASRDAFASVDDRASPDPGSRPAKLAPDPPISPAREGMTGLPATFTHQPGQRYVIVLGGGQPAMVASWERHAWERHGGWHAWERHGGYGKHRRKKWRDRDD